MALNDGNYYVLTPVHLAWHEIVALPTSIKLDSNSTVMAFSLV